MIYLQIYLYFGQFCLRGSRMSPPLLRLCFHTQPRREATHATASECTASFQSNQATSTQVSHASIRIAAYAPRSCHLSQSKIAIAPITKEPLLVGTLKAFDFVSLNKAAITHVMIPEHEQAFVIDASFVSKSGKQTYGLDRFWNGSHSRSEKGLEISALAWLDITANCAYILSVEQTPPSSGAIAPAIIRIDVYLAQLIRVVVCA